MSERFNLIKSEQNFPEKRILPRFPFNYMTFKSETADDRAFEVADISSGGMRLALRDGSHSYRPGDEITGRLHWRKIKLNLQGQVAWTAGQTLGVRFEEHMANDVSELLKVDNIIEGLKPIHSSQMDLHIPNNLKYWLRSDGPVEIFYWVHNEGDFKHIQFCLYDKYFEWEDGKGLRSGTIIERKRLDSPLNIKDEFSINFDEELDNKSVGLVNSLLAKVPESLLPREASDFILLKTTRAANAS